MKIVSRWVWTLTALASVWVANPAFAQTTGMRPDDWHGGWGWGWGHMVFGSLMMLLFWGAVVLAIVFVVRWLGMAAHRPEPPASENRALAILEERFARGEIDVKEFEERKRMLSS
jgi:putative membrane protein